MAKLHIWFVISGIVLLIHVMSANSRSVLVWGFSAQLESCQSFEKYNLSRFPFPCLKWMREDYTLWCDQLVRCPSFYFWIGEQWKCQIFAKKEIIYAWILLSTCAEDNLSVDSDTNTPISCCDLSPFVWPSVDTLAITPANTIPLIPLSHITLS